MKTHACFSDPDARALLEELCDKHHVDLQLIVDLCEVTDSFSGSGRKEGVTAEIAARIDEFMRRNESTA